MADIDIPTFLTSVMGSLIVSYIGVRYFTGAKIRAEKAEAARSELAALVRPWLRTAKQYAQRRSGTPRREFASPLGQDGTDAIAVLTIAENLPWFRRALIRRRCRRIFGERWTALASTYVPASAGQQGNGMQVTIAALLDQRDDTAQTTSYRSGLIHRVYSSSTGHGSKTLVKELQLLSRAR